MLAPQSKAELQIKRPRGSTHYRVTHRYPRRLNRNDIIQIAFKFSGIALIFASKQICAETAPILYGTRHFRFQDMSVLEQFLDQINENKRHLRTISVPDFGWDDESYNPARRAMKALMAAGGLRTLGITCPKSLRRVSHDRLTVIVAICKPFLEELKRSGDSNNVSKSILDVLKVDLGPGLFQRHETIWHSPRCKNTVDCECSDYLTTVRVKRFDRQLREVVAAELDISDKLEQGIASWQRQILTRLGP